jgi:hypothetical protein
MSVLTSGWTKRARHRLRWRVPDCSAGGAHPGRRQAQDDDDDDKKSGWNLDKKL